METAVSARPRGGPVGVPCADRTLVMGVLNVTPDSFSDGGLWLDVDTAVAHGLDMVAEGADLVDVGGESTRPGAGRVDEAEEVRRVLPVVTALAGAGVAVSVDTMRSTVAAAAVDAGAVLVNDVSGGLADPQMYPLVADLGVAYVANHWRGHADLMDTLDQYGDVVADVRADLAGRVDAMRAAGIADEQVVLDPGLGFAKAAVHAWPLLARLDELLADGFPVLVGASRKRFLGTLLDRSDGPPSDRDAATAAISALAAAAGVWAVRVHEMRSSVDAVRVAQAWRAARNHGKKL